MKTIKSVLRDSLGIALFLLCITGITNCDDNNSLHQQYIDRGEILYTGQCDFIKAFAGNERVKLTWLVNSDPRISKTRIYWNEKADSVEIPVVRTEKGPIQMETVQPVKEGSYSFIFVTLDDYGNSSMEVERSVSVYGSRYISTLNNRTLQHSAGWNNSLTINWDPVESTLVQYVTVKYTDHSDPAHPALKSVVVKNGDTQTLIPGVKSDDTFSVITTFLPENGIDPVDAIASDYIVIFPPPAAYPDGIPHKPGRVEAEYFDFGGEGVSYHDSEETNIGNGSYRTGLYDQGVDITLDPTLSNSYGITSTSAGEWLNYTINVPEAGIYDFSFVTWSDNSSLLDLLLDGKQIAQANLPNTHSAHQKSTVPRVELPAGIHVLTLRFNAGPGLDYFEYQLSEIVELVDKSQFSISGFSSQETAGWGGYHPADYILDNDVDTDWGTQWSAGGQAPFPHWVVIDLGQSFDIAQIEIYRSGWFTKNVEFYLGDDSAHDALTWRMLSSFTYSSDGAESLKTLYFAPDINTDGRYLKIVIPDSHNSWSTDIQIAEIFIYAR